MKSIKEGCEGLIRMLFNKRGIVVRTPVSHRDYDYWDLQEEDFVHNPIVGMTSVSHIRELQKRGVIVYKKGAWRVPTEECNNYKGEKRIKPTEKFLFYKQNKFKIDAEIH